MAITIGYCVGGCRVSAGIFIEKNPTAMIIHAIHTIIKPTRIIDRTAPMSQIRPAVSKVFSPDFVERASKDFLKNTAEMIRDMTSVK